MKSLYQKLFSRDFSLPSVEAWVRGESTNPKGWITEKQPFLPYIITERSDDTVRFYYDLKGVAWVQNLLVKLAHKDNNFIRENGIISILIRQQLNLIGDTDNLY